MKDLGQKLSLRQCIPSLPVDSKLEIQTSRYQSVINYFDRYIENVLITLINAKFNSLKYDTLMQALVTLFEI